MKKYILTDETVPHNGRTLHRIQAVRSFSDVTEGDLGGYVESEDNLSHDGDCWVYDNTRVFYNARVLDDARVYDNARVLDFTRVSGNTTLSGSCWVYDHAIISGNTRVSGNERVFELDMNDDPDEGKTDDKIYLERCGV